MNRIIKKEFIEFEKYHKNIYNVYFHIICGFIFMTFLFLLSKKYSNVLLIIYSLLILFTIYNLFITIIICIILFIMVYSVKKYKFKTEIIFLLFLIFYFLPDLSHYVTNEPSVLNINNITPLSFTPDSVHQEYSLNQEALIPSILSSSLFKIIFFSKLS